MTSLFEQIPYLSNYSLSFAVLVGLSLVTLVQSFLTAPLAFVSEEQVPGMPLANDHNSLSFRAIRTYQNSVESLPAFVAALLVAIIVGANPSVVNWAAGIYFAARMMFWAIYYAGVGKVAGGPRTLVYVIGLVANVTIAVTAILAFI